MRTTHTLAWILSRRLDKPEPFEVRLSVSSKRVFQAPIIAVHQDVLEFADGTFVSFQYIAALRIVEL